MNLNQKFFWTILTTFFSQDLSRSNKKQNAKERVVNGTVLFYSLERVLW